MNDSIGNRLRRWRKAIGLSQEEAARLLGCSTGAYRKWESDEVEPTGRDFVYRDRVAKLLDRFESRTAVPSEGREG